MALPRAIQTVVGVGLQVVDFADQPLHATAGADGIMTCSYDQIDPAYLWRVERIVVVATSLAQLEVTVYCGSGTPSTVQARDWTPLPAGFVGVAEYPSLLTVRGGDALTVQATGGAPGDVLTTSAQYQLVQRVPGG